MKMIGRSTRSMMRFWRSSPLRLGSFTSRTRQPGPSMFERSRNSSADANVSGRHPAERINNSSDSRTDTSSSTTKTTGVSHAITRGGDPLRGSRGELMLHSRFQSLPTKRAADRVEEGSLAEWLDEAANGAAVNQERTVGHVLVARDEHDRDLPLSPGQFLLQVGARHPGHHDVEEQTVGFAESF